MDDLFAELQEKLNNQIKTEAFAIERAIEEAIQGGDCGVLVIRDRYQRLVSAAPNPMVAYGSIYVMLEYDFNGFVPTPTEGGAGA